MVKRVKKVMGSWRVWVEDGWRGNFPTREIALKVVKRMMWYGAVEGRNYNLLLFWKVEKEYS